MTDSADVIYTMKKFGIYNIYEKLLSIDTNAAQQFFDDVEKQMDELK